MLSFSLGKPPTPWPTFMAEMASPGADLTECRFLVNRPLLLMHLDSSSCCYLVSVRSTLEEAAVLSAYEGKQVAGHVGCIPSGSGGEATTCI